MRIYGDLCFDTSLVNCYFFYTFLQIMNKYVRIVNRVIYFVPIKT